jgi:hypothetical protein
VELGPVLLHGRLLRLGMGPFAVGFGEEVILTVDAIHLAWLAGEHHLTAVSEKLTQAAGDTSGVELASRPLAL